MSDFLTSWKNNSSYFETLQILASLSELFSDSSVPYLDYRLAENVFCNFYNAVNEARSCTAYDARIGGLGIGIKTFILKNDKSSEKVAEFNRLKTQLDPLNGIELAKKLGEFRNDRIFFADRSYGTSERIYHIVGRTENSLRIFNTRYDTVDVNNISIMHDSGKTFSFTDGICEYFFNRSKSVLIRRFNVPYDDFMDVPVTILNDPLTILLDFFRERKMNTEKKDKNVTDVHKTFLTGVRTYVPGVDYVILPLYSTRGQSHEVPEKSGLNQWNAGGRQRDPNEIYIPIPRRVHNDYPDFFPNRDEHFTLLLPNRTHLSAKVCQDNSKALMSTHNADLGKWLLRTVLHKPEGELVTMNDLNHFGVDSIRVINEHRIDKEGRKVYSISFTASDYETYSEFTDSYE